MTHELKIWPEHWKRVSDGTKTFEIRLNDRGYQKGDKVVLKPYNMDLKRYLDSEDGYYDIHRDVGDVYPIDADRVVFSLLPSTDPF